MRDMSRMSLMSESRYRAERPILAMQSAAFSRVAHRLRGDRVHADDRVERRADLVAHAREEVRGRLGAAGLLRVGEKKHEERRLHLPPRGVSRSCSKISR
jgi:hypothetical protein